MKRREGTARFVALHHWMLKSTAFRALSPNAKAVLLHVWERHNGSNNGQIVYATREGDMGLNSLRHQPRNLPSVCCAIFRLTGLWRPKRAA